MEIVQMAASMTRPEVLNSERNRIGCLEESPSSTNATKGFL
ncbi:hypothetical protein Salmuc_02087 [Salipiger mucosus DSM 16094]|uniref:Uncharacterized protein n=1 Tax=Salipiger mucosus DSM 16094 TaxID=1123237 RepID=S9SB68_9RHOB|nr:hypothetical protein Salmuc_02087 [Salipiger mucosus DSM 16094]